MPLLILLLLFVVELTLWIEWGSRLGVFTIILQIVISAVVGVQLMRWTGLRVLREMSAGQMSTMWLQVRQQTIMRRLLGGLLLVVPGFATDALGLVLFAWSLLGPKAPPPPPPTDAAAGRRHGVVIEGDYERRDER